MIGLRWMVGLAVVLGAGCDSGTEPGPEPEPEDQAWFEVGWGETGFSAIDDGSQLRVVWGSQGAAMFPLSLRAGNFELPPDPGDLQTAPTFQMWIDIPGYELSAGHFKRIANYPVQFTVLEDGSYEFIYVPVIVPDTVEPSELRGLPAELWGELSPDSVDEPIEFSRSVTVVVDDP